MSHSDSHAATASAPSPDIAALLQRILAAVETDRRRGRLELVIAIILSLTTLITTWCGYQARLWGGIQSERHTAADTAERQAAEHTIAGLEIRTQDGVLLMEYWRALRAGDTRTAENINAHFRPPLRAATAAAIAAGLLADPTVTGPLQRPEYQLSEDTSAALEREQAMQFRTQASTAGHTASGYVVLTLVCASVLFFGGIAGTFKARRVRNGLAFVSVGLFIGVVIMLLRLPTLTG